MDISRIQDKCWDKHITIAELERNVGLKNGAISKWKKSSPRLVNIQKIASYFDCGVDDLIIPESAENDQCQG